MNYVSENLCHFVGRSLPNAMDRFRLLIKIIKDQQLKANLSKPNNPEIRFTNTYHGESLGEIFEHIDCVCFCDIPDNLLSIHTEKYSQFGMGFTKKFLAMQEARPVTYVPKDAKMQEPAHTCTPTGNPTEYYLHLNKLSINFKPILCLLNAFYPLKNLLSQLMSTSDDNLMQSLSLYDPSIVNAILDGKAHSMIYSDLMGWAAQNAYIKVFDETLTDNDPENYYMEREWRSIKSVDFTITDIQKVYLPTQHFKNCFLEEFPNFTGDFWIFDEKADNI